MQQRVCPTCGQPLHDGGLHGAEFLEADEPGPRFDPRRLLVAGATALGALLLVLIVVDALGEDDGGNAAVPEDPDDPAPSTTEISSEQRVEAARAALQAVLGDVRLAYRAENEVVVIDTRDGAEPARAITPEPVEMGDLLAGFDGVTLLTDELSTFALIDDDEGDRDGLSVLQVSNATGEIVPYGGQEFAIAGDPDDPANQIIIGTSAGMFLAPVALPLGATQLNVPGLGVVVVAPSGESYIARLGEFTPLSEHRVVGANPTHHIEIRCDSPLVCEPWLFERLSGLAVALPSRYAGDDGVLSISPDGRWVLVTGGSVDELLDTDSMEARPLEAGPKGPAHWLDDSSTAIWLDPVSFRPLLRVLDAAAAEVAPFDLAEVGGLARTGAQIVDVG